MKKFAILLSALCASFAAAADLKPAPQKEADFALFRLSPMPKEAAFFEGFYTLSDKSVVKISTAAEVDRAQKKEIAGIFKRYWRLSPTLEFSSDAGNLSLGEEGSKISITPNALAIDARDFGALRQALKTLRQLAEPERDGNGQVFQCAKIKDWASLKFRGIHICIFPETTLEDVEKFARLASYYKFNYIVLEPWGVFPFESHPEFAFADKKIDRAKFKKIIDYCRSVGLTPIPQLSILGHAAQCRSKSAKHAVLSRSPELAHIYEPIGWSYCMSSAQTEKILKDLLAELHEFFGNPPFFHLGCDEAYDKGTCYKCRQTSTAKLFAAHLKKFSDFMLARGARPIIWHDMLLDRADPRWAKDVATGNAEFVAALDDLTRDVIIADWQYSYRDKKQTRFETPRHFKKAGFDVLVCPWEAGAGIDALARTAAEEKLFGFLETTWHHINRRHLYHTFFFLSGDAAWNGGISAFHKERHTPSFREMQMIPQIAHVLNDMREPSYEAAGAAAQQIEKSLSD